MSDDREPIRVLLDCRMADWAGVGRYTRSLTLALAELPDIELIQAVGRSDAAPASTADWISVTGHPFTVAGAARLGRAARRTAPDIVHCLHFPTPLPAPHPLVVTIHDLIPLTVPGVMPSRVRRAGYAWWNRRAARIADAVIAVSEYTAGEFARIHPSAADRISVVH